MGMSRFVGVHMLSYNRSI